MRPASHLRPAPPPGVLRVGLALALVALMGAPTAQAGLTSPYVRKKLVQLAPGITWEKGTARTSSGVQSIQVGRIDTENPSVSLQSLLSNDRVVKLERPSLNASRNSRPGSLAMLATNGDVSTAGDTGAGAVMPSMHVHGEELMVGTICGRPTLGIDADGKAHMRAVKNKMTLDMTSVVPGWRGTVAIRGINRPRSGSQLILYTPRFGNSTLTTSSGTDVIIAPSGPVRVNGRITATVVEKRTGVQNTVIPAGRMVLSAASSGDADISQLSAGDEIAIETSITIGDGNSCAPGDVAPGWGQVVEVMGGNYFTAYNGQNVAPTASQYSKGGIPAPRTNVGITADGQVLMVVVDGRQGYSVGMTLIEMGDLMLSLGAVSAFNLDGGGSSVMATRPPGATDIAVSNQPSDGRERSLTQALAAFSVSEP